MLILLAFFAVVIAARACTAAVQAMRYLPRSNEDLVYF